MSYMSFSVNTLTRGKIMTIDPDLNHNPKPGVVERAKIWFWGFYYRWFV